MFFQGHEGDSKIKGEVLDKISYEVKDSLNSIIGFSSIIKNSCIDPKQLEQIENVLISSEKLLEFANNISGFSKLITGKYETNYHTFSTKKLMNELLNSFEPTAQKKKVDFKLEISEVKIKNDYQITSQIIYGLLNYLIKLSCEGNFIFVKNTATTEGVLIKIKTNVMNFINQKNPRDLNDILNAKDGCYENLEFYLTNHLIGLTEGQILFSNSKNNSSKIQIYIPNKLA